MSQPSVRAASEDPEAVIEQLVKSFAVATAEMDRLEELLAVVRSKRKAAVVAMHQTGQSYREIGGRLGVSTQRAQAIATSSPRPQTRRKAKATTAVAA